MEQMTGHNKSEFFWFTQKREVLLPPLGVNVNCEAFFVKGSLTQHHKSGPLVLTGTAEKDEHSTANHHCSPSKRRRRSGRRAREGRHLIPEKRIGSHLSDLQSL